MHRFTNGILAAMLAATVACHVSCADREDANLKMPSAVVASISDSLRARVWRSAISSQDEYNDARGKFASALVDSMRRDGLDGEERFSRAKVLYWSGRRRPAERLFSSLAKEGGELARKAAALRVTMRIEEERFEEAERMMKKFRDKFPPDSESETNLYLCVDDIAGRYNNADRPADAIRVIMDELDGLPFDYPHPSFFLLEELVPLMTETERLPELRERVRSYRERFSESLEAHLDASAPPDSTRGRYDDLTKSFENEIAHLDGILTRLDLIGTEAPPLRFRHVYNAAPSSTFDGMKGKVTVIDFWATWCIACVIGYRELDNLYADYRDRGLAIVGVTSLQGKYRDREAGVREGTDEEPLAEGREIELTSSYIEKHRIAWPCGISETSVMNPEYRIKGLPTYVILDREGRIRYMQLGIGKERQMRRIIEKLLREA